MQSTFSSVFVLTLTVLATVNGIPCPAFVPVPNLDLESVISNHTAHGWLTLEGTDPRIGCLNVEFEADDLTMEPVTIYVNMEYLLLDSLQAVSLNYEATVPDLQESGVWQVRDEEGNHVYTFYILYLDDQYSLTAQCTDDGDSRVLFNTRGSMDHMPPPIVRKLQAILVDEYGLDVSGYHQVNHDHHLCHQFEGY